MAPSRARTFPTRALWHPHLSPAFPPPPPPPQVRLEMGLTFLFRLDPSCVAAHVGERAVRGGGDDGRGAKEAEEAGGRGGGGGDAASDAAGSDA